MHDTISQRPRPSPDRSRHRPHGGAKGGPNNVMLRRCQFLGRPWGSCSPKAKVTRSNRVGRASLAT